MSAHPEECLISMAGVWEASIKTSLGKLTLPYDIRTDLPRLSEKNGFAPLPVAFDDATGVIDLFVTVKEGVGEGWRPGKRGLICWN
jgi:PIN domain nuclease of toxin-antitoxin system